MEAIRMEKIGGLLAISRCGERALEEEGLDRIAKPSRGWRWCCQKRNSTRGGSLTTTLLRKDGSAQAMSDPVFESARFL
jgi:hypothetical protein